MRRTSPFLLASLVFYGAVACFASQWHEISIPASYQRLHCMVMVTPESGWAGGQGGLLLRCEGGQWRKVTAPIRSDVVAMAFDDAENGWMAGFDAATQKSLLFHCQRGRWTPVQVPVGLVVTAIASDGRGTLFVFGQGGRAFRLRQRVWVETGTPGYRTMLSAVSLPDGTVWAVGEFGSAWRWNGSSWQATQTPVRSHLHAVTASKDGKIWAVGDQGVILFHEGDAWRQKTAPSSKNLYAVSARGASEAWFGGEKVLLHWTGSEVQIAPVEVRGVVRGVDVFESGTGWAVGLGTVLRLDPHTANAGGSRGVRFGFYRQELLPNALGIHGAAFGDCNGDGLDDLFLVSMRDANHLLVNRGGGSFGDETGARGLMGTVVTVPVVKEMAQFGASWGDYDNDGRLDLAVAGWYGSTYLYRQNSARRFDDVTDRLGLREGPFSANSVTFSDVNRDGLLDLFVCNEHGSNVLWLNNGRGGWTDATRRWGLTSRGGSKDAVFGDLDNDGDADLFVCNGNGRNLVYRNDGKRFVDMSPTCAAAGERAEHNGATLADLDNDGDLDIVTTTSDGQNRIWRNNGGWRFEDASGIVGFASGPFSYGSAAGDFDNDGFLDLLIAGANGVTFFRNAGDLRFIPVAVEGLTDVKDARAIAVSDVDADGDLDVFVSSKADFTDGFSDFEQRRSACFFNRLDLKNSISVRCEGVSSNRMAVGARVRLFRDTGAPPHAGELVGTREIMASNGCRSQQSAAAHFGVDPASRYTVRVTFPSGREVERRNVRAGQRLVIAEITGPAAVAHRVAQTTWRSIWSNTARRHVFPLVVVIPLLVWAFRNASQRLLWGSLVTNLFTVALSAAYALLALATVSSSWWVGVLVPAVTVSLIAFLVVGLSYWSGPRAADKVAFRRRLAALEARADVTGVLSESLDTAELAKHALEEFSDLFPVTLSVLVLCKHSSDTIEIVVPVEPPIPGLAPGLPLPEAIAETSSAGPIIWEKDFGVPPPRSGLVPLCVVLSARGARVGVILSFVARRQLGEAMATESAMRSYAAFVGMSLFNAQLQQHARMRDEAFRVWLKGQGLGIPPDRVPSASAAHRELTRRLAVIKKNPPAELGTFESLTGDSTAIREVRKRLQQVAGTDTSVLLLGPSGTGKELAARAIHGQSKRKNGPFVPVNCGAIPEGLLESELFGHTKGAFTGAHAARSGVFQRAHHGTIFLDEIAEMNPSAQIRLLRVLQERSVTPVGGETAVPVDVRVIAATHQDLGVAVAEGRFREDLFYRLNVFPIHLPTLAERMEDIPALVAALLYRISLKTNLPLTGMAEDAVERILAHLWQGNVRELENCLERALLLAGGEIIRSVHLQFDTAGPGTTLIVRNSAEAPVGRKLADVEQELVEETLRDCNFNVSEAARRLGISRDILRYRIKKLNISREKIRRGTAQ
ncbi:MAG TPA: sigma 54-interacting transcriptional regulator [Candidatus Latescibacteria bacterium]|nr:sigma 54-interacting transcriptional regulator [Candidatus Latescibacterota bacterium]